MYSSPYSVLHLDDDDDGDDGEANLDDAYISRYIRLLSEWTNRKSS